MLCVTKIKASNRDSRPPPLANHGRADRQLHQSKRQLLASLYGLGSANLKNLQIILTDSENTTQLQKESSDSRIQG